MTTAAHSGGLALRGAAARCRRWAVSLALAAGLAACASGSGGQEPAMATAPAGNVAGSAEPATPIQDDSYILGPGDQLQVTVFGHENLSGEFQVGSTGAVSLPLIGDVPAGGHTLRQVETEIVDKLSPEYLRDPTVSVQVLEYRLFYVLGEVKNPGGYPYVSGLRAVNAVALAGGYTYRADTDDLLIRRASGGPPQPADPGTQVYPGDTIQVQERWF